MAKQQIWLDVVRIMTIGKMLSSKHDLSKLGKVLDELKLYENKIHQNTHTQKKKKKKKKVL